MLSYQYRTHDCSPGRVKEVLAIVESGEADRMQDAYFESMTRKSPSPRKCHGEHGQIQAVELE